MQNTASSDSVALAATLTRLAGPGTLADLGYDVRVINSACAVVEGMSPVRFGHRPPLLG